MRMVLLLIAVGLLLVEAGGLARTAGRAKSFSSANVSSGTAAQKPHVDFETQIKPFLQSKCMPCHFSGGQMYERLPFDKPATIRKLGTKLFTRIKDEEKRRLIEDFLAQAP